MLQAGDRDADPEAAFDAWCEAQRLAVDRAHTMLDDIATQGVFDLATLSVALRELRALN